MRLGARILKTGIAIILAMSIASLLPDNIGLKSLAGVSAVVAMQPSVYKSIKTVSDQAIGNIIGALLAVTMVTIFSDNFIIMGVTVILLIAILFRFNLAHVATLASVTALIIMGQHTGSFYVAAFFRFVLVMIGVLSSSIVNLLFLPPKFETKIYYNSANISSDIFVWFKLVLNDTSEFHNIKQDGDQLNTRINKLEQIYNFYHEERPLFKKHIHAQYRKKILFKEVVRTTRLAYEVLNRMSRYQNDLHQLNNQLLLQIKLELDSLIAFHEQILKSLSKKAKYNVAQFQYEVDNPQKKDLMDAFQNELIHNPYQTHYSYANIMQIIAAIEEYRYHLEHLDRLRISFFTYHRSDSDIDIADEDFDL
ncbi:MULTISPECIES: FUSC family protein [Staphylococcus]|uniref:FUSC family protein n=1 Tax=Staphylococcus TaxID=1279 RepID=UPI0002463F14|nr:MULTISPECIES: aromatic acid exporter family protein [Staphylococcus]QAV32118.1 aromatic acid exporter family protein [Sulfitobacter donghicola]KAB7643944.1 aromatic acid exporter family protein [Staphylococcus sp. B2-b]MBN6853870.1 aromatic acid exporter family protein [Staphylococcus warneri]MBT2770257.1 aromatic acid exporter family protein [Staphylococcus warneri]MBX7841168.1 aromatic acid exporter family protein [Staphylococcus warneri]